MKSFSVFSLPLIAVSVLLFITSFALSGEISFPTTHPSTAVSDILLLPSLILGHRVLMTYLKSMFGGIMATYG